MNWGGSLGLREGSEMEFGIPAKATVIAAIVLVAGLAFIAPAYSYSSIVTTNGTITYEYITINVYDSEDAATGLEFLNINKEAWSVDHVTTNGFDLTPADGTAYSVQTLSNKDQSPTGAYLYGYFTGGGAGIDTITVTFGTGGSTSEFVLYRDAAVNQKELTNGISGETAVNSWVLPITKFHVTTFDGLQIDKDGKIPVKEGASDIVDQPLNDLFSIDGLTFHFYATWESLTTSA